MEKDETIVEGNRLIAEFMGYTWCPENTLNGIVGVLTHPDKMSMHLNFDKPFHAKYHTSWDWLLPCVRKFNDMVLTGDIEHDMESSAIHDLMEHSILLINLTAAHNYFVQLLQWYNTTKPPAGQ